MPETTQQPALRNAVLTAIAKLAQEAGTAITDATPLIGDGSEFDWTSEPAMSRSRIIFRTAGALAAGMRAIR